MGGGGGGGGWGGGGGGAGGGGGGWGSWGLAGPAGRAASGGSAGRRAVGWGGAGRGGRRACRSPLRAAGGAVRPRCLQEASRACAGSQDAVWTGRALTAAARLRAERRGPASEERGDAGGDGGAGRAPPAERPGAGLRGAARGGGGGDDFLRAGPDSAGPWLRRPPGPGAALTPRSGFRKCKRQQRPQQGHGADQELHLPALAGSLAGRTQPVAQWPRSLLGTGDQALGSYGPSSIQPGSLGVRPFGSLLGPQRQLAEGRVSPS